MSLPVCQAKLPPSHPPHTDPALHQNLLQSLDRTETRRETDNQSQKRTQVQPVFVSILSYALAYSQSSGLFLRRVSRSRVIVIFFLREQHRISEDVDISSLHTERDAANTCNLCVHGEMLKLLKVELSVHLCFTSPSDVQVSPLARPRMVSVHILTPKAQETVHAHIQASLTLL